MKEELRELDEMSKDLPTSDQLWFTFCLHISQTQPHLSP